MSDGVRLFNTHDNCVTSHDNMGPTRSTKSKQTSVPDNLELPENWTAEKLRRELCKMAVNIPSDLRKKDLIKLYKDHQDRPRDAPTPSTSAGPRPIDITASEAGDLLPNLIRNERAREDVQSAIATKA